MIMKQTKIALRPIPTTDAESIADILLDTSVKQSYMVGDLAKEEAYQMGLRIASLSCTEDRYVRGIYMNNGLVGFLNDVEIKDGTIELGWVIAPAHQGNGYATEAVRIAIDDLFSKGYIRVIAGAFSENSASIRVMEKAGMIRQELTELIEYRGITHTCIYYAKDKA